MKKLLFQLVCALGSLLAITSVAGACGFWTYQPEVPDRLLKK